MNQTIFFVKKLNTIINNDNQFIKRHDKNNKLDLRNTLFTSVYALHSSGLDNALGKLDLQKGINVSKTALVNKRNNDVTNVSFKNINDQLIDMIYDPSNNIISQYNFKIASNNTSYVRNIGLSDKSLFINRTNKRFVASDGMQLNLNKLLINNNDIKKSPNDNYGIAIISSIYDVINDIPINYYLTKCQDKDIDKKKVNETNGFLDQLSYLSSNDIVIFDRWYFSQSLVKTLNENNIGYIFRMKSRSKFFNNMSLGKSKIVRYMGTDVQLFKYKIKSENYYILTSITDNISIKEIKAMYHKRWKIETDNKKFKYDVLYNNVRSKNYNSLLVDIESIRFVSICTAFIEYLGKDSIKSRTKINSKNCLQVFYEELIYPILFGEDNERNYKNICRILGVIYKIITYIVENRNYERKRISPSTKWNINGNRYGNKKQ